MKRIGAIAVLLSALAAATVAWGGHELPIYPSFYPHEIEIQTIAPEQAPAALLNARIHAYVGQGARFSGAQPDVIGSVESLGSFVMVRVNPQSPLARDERSTCAAAKFVVREVAKDDVVFHPYPVTPLHGDYLYHVDLAEAAKARFTSAPEAPPVPNLKVKATGSVAQTHPAWSTQAADWDVEVFDVDAANLVVASTRATNGWIAPPWIKTGWFHAEHLLADSVERPCAEGSRRRRFSAPHGGRFQGSPGARQSRT